MAWHKKEQSMCKIVIAPTHTPPLSHKSNDFLLDESPVALILWTFDRVLLRLVDMTDDAIFHAKKRGIGNPLSSQFWDIIKYIGYGRSYLTTLCSNC